MIPTFDNLLFVIKSQPIKCAFYTRCMEYIKRKPANEKIYIIEESPYIVEPLRIYIKRQTSIKYNLYFADYIPLNIKDLMARELPLHNENDYKVLAFRLGVALLQNPKYLIITSSSEIVDGIQIKDNHENMSFLFGIASYDMIKYHNIDNIKEDKLAHFREFSNNTTIQEKERVLITGDIQLDLLGHSNNYNPKIAGLVIGTAEPFKFITTFKNKNIPNTKFRYVMSTTIFNDEFVKEGNFINVWYNKSLPQHVGEHTILDILCNPEHHHYYMGVKFVNIDLLCFKYLNTATAMSYYNLLLLQKNVKYNKYKICFPNLVPEKGKVTIFTEDHINLLSKQIASIAKDKNLTVNIKKCHETPFDVYSRTPTRLTFSIIILKYHGMFADYIINKYFDKTSLLDIGAGPLRRVLYYEQIGFKHLVAIEPSEESIKLGFERFEKCKQLSLDYIKGIGDEDWSSSVNYAKVMENAPYKSILFKFTIHYMVHHFDILFKNLKKVVDADDCTIIVTCVNSKKVIECIGDSDRYEIYDGDMPIYGIYNMDSDEKNSNFIKKMFYFSSVYGVESGSIEYLVDIDYLVKMFDSIGFYVEVNAGFLDIPISELKHTLDKLSPLQKKIPELQQLLIFKNKSK